MTLLMTFFVLGGVTKDDDKMGRRCLKNFTILSCGFVSEEEGNEEEGNGMSEDEGGKLFPESMTICVASYLK